MTENSSGTWNTKFGSRRVRQEPPTVDEALAAAMGLTDDPKQQVEIAASLIGASVEEVRVAALKSTQRKDVHRTVTFTKRAGAERAVIVERKPARRFAQGKPTFYRV